MGSRLCSFPARGRRRFIISLAPAQQAPVAQCGCRLCNVPAREVPGASCKLNASDTRHAVDSALDDRIGSTAGGVQHSTTPN